MPKYLKAKKPTEYADRLHEIQMQTAELRKQLRMLDAEEESIITYLSKTTKDESFQFEGSDGYLKECTYSFRSRQDIDGDKVRRLLGNKTPYKTTKYTVVKVKWAV